MSGAAQGTPAWLKEREGKLTASVFGQAAGLGPSSRQQLWRRIMGLEEVEFNAGAMRYGIEHEPIAREAYKNICGLSVRIEQTGFVVHPEHSWLGASPDLLIDDDGLGEIKCPANMVIYPEVPPYYMAQMQGQMEVTNREWCDFIVWTPDAMSVRTIKRSRKYWMWLHEKLAEFWIYVQAACEPPRMKRHEPPDISDHVSGETIFSTNRKD